MADGILIQSDIFNSISTVNGFRTPHTIKPWLRCLEDYGIFSPYIPISSDIQGLSLAEALDVQYYNMERSTNPRQILLLCPRS